MKTARREREKREMDLTTAKMHAGHPSLVSQLVNTEDVSNAVVNALSGRLDGITGKLDGISKQLESMGIRIQEAEERISMLEDDLHSANNKITSLQETISKQGLKIDDLENRSRRKNLRIIGIPETVKDAELNAYFFGILKFLNLNEGSNHFTLERIHRLGRPRPDDTRPRIVMARFISIQHKDRVLRVARAKGPLMFEGVRIQVFQDYSIQLSLKRKAYANICQQLLSSNLKFMLQYPARLRIFYNGKAVLMESPEEAKKWFHGNIAGIKDNT